MAFGSPPLPVRMTWILGFSSVWFVSFPHVCKKQLLLPHRCVSAFWLLCCECVPLVFFPCGLRTDTHLSALSFKPLPPVRNFFLLREVSPPSHWEALFSQSCAEPLPSSDRHPCELLAEKAGNSFLFLVIACFPGLPTTLSVPLRWEKTTSPGCINRLSF